MADNEIEIKAIETEKFEEMLTELGLSEKFNSGKVQCEKCEGKISKIEDISYIYREHGIKFVCNRKQCLIGDSLD